MAKCPKCGHEWDPEQIERQATEQKRRDAGRHQRDNLLYGVVWLLFGTVIAVTSVAILAGWIG